MITNIQRIINNNVMLIGILRIRQAGHEYSLASPGHPYRFLCPRWVSRMLWFDIDIDAVIDTKHASILNYGLHVSPGQNK